MDDDENRLNKLLGKTKNEELSKILGKDKNKNEDMDRVLGKKKTEKNNQVTCPKCGHVFEEKN